MPKKTPQNIIGKFILSSFGDLKNAKSFIPALVRILVFPSGYIFEFVFFPAKLVCQSMAMHAHMGIYGTEGRLDFALLTVRSI